MTGKKLSDKYRTNTTDSWRFQDNEEGGIELQKKVYDDWKTKLIIAEDGNISVVSEDGTKRVNPNTELLKMINELANRLTLLEGIKENG